MFFGFLGAICDLFVLVPQVFHTWKTQDVSGLSFCTLILTLGSGALWGIHGLFNFDIALMASAFLHGLCAGFLITMYLRFKKAKPPPTKDVEFTGVSTTEK